MVGQGRDSEDILREHRESERHRGKFKDPKRYRLMGRKPLRTHLFFWGGEHDDRDRNQAGGIMLSL